MAASEDVLAVPVAEPTLTVPRASPWLPRLAVLGALVAVLEAAFIAYASSLGDPEVMSPFALDAFGLFAATVTFPLVGALILTRRPRTRVAWVMVAIGLSIGTGNAAAAWGAIGIPGPTLPLAVPALVISPVFVGAALILGFTMLMLLYPTDQLPGRRWTSVAILAAVGFVLFEAATLLRPDDLFPGQPNPLAAPIRFEWVITWAGYAGLFLAIGSVLAAVVSLVVRYRMADAIEAAQIRWFAVVGGLAAICVSMAIIDLGEVTVVLFGSGLVLLALLPVAIGVAISRYRLYDIDRLINRALVYGALTAVLAGVFTAGVGLGQRLFVSVTGQSSDAAIVAATLVVATLYAPLRKRLESFIDKRFKYETRRFGSYADRVHSVLAVIDPVRAAENLAREAVAELDATGAAVVDRAGALVASAGSWPPADPAAVTEIRLSGEGQFGAIVLGPRRGVRGGARPYQAEDLAELAEAGRLTAAAVRPA